jgi:CspA family cold shock protein
VKAYSAIGGVLMGEKASFMRHDEATDEAFVGNEGGDTAGIVEISGAIKWFDVAVAARATS